MCVVVLLQLLQQDIYVDLDGDVCQVFEVVVVQCVKMLCYVGSGKEFILVDYFVLFQQCCDMFYGMQCELMLVDLQGEGGFVQCVYVVFGWQDYQEVICQVQCVVEEDLQNLILQLLLIIMLLVGDCVQVVQVCEWLDMVLVVRFVDVGLLMQCGYFNQCVGQFEQVLVDFCVVQVIGKVLLIVVLDQVYVSVVSGDNCQVVSLLCGVIDSVDVGMLKLDKSQCYNICSLIVNFLCEWGIIVLVGYCGVCQVVINLGGVVISMFGDLVFGMLEVFWCLLVLNICYGMLEVYVCIVNMLYDEGGIYELILVVDFCMGVVIEDVCVCVECFSWLCFIVGWLFIIVLFGVCYVFGQIGLSVGIECCQFIGMVICNGGVYLDLVVIQCCIQLEFSQLLQMIIVVCYWFSDNVGGWMFYLIYGFYNGIGVCIDVNQWWIISGYVQVGFSWDDNCVYFIVDCIDMNGDMMVCLIDFDGCLCCQQWFGVVELCVGCSYCFGVDQICWVINFYLVVGVDWIDQCFKVCGIVYLLIGVQFFDLFDIVSSWLLGVGLGVGVCYWFCEDYYNVVCLYFDLGVQYCFVIGGGDIQWVKGLFVIVMFYY